MKKCPVKKHFLKKNSLHKQQKHLASEFSDNSDAPQSDSDIEDPFVKHATRSSLANIALSISSGPIAP